MNEEEIYKLILHGGDGRSCAMEAIAAAKQGDYQLAHQKLKESAEALVIAHQMQTSFVQEEIKEGRSRVSLLMVHAQDHLMNAMTVRDLATEFVELYERGDVINGS